MNQIVEKHLFSFHENPTGQNFYLDIEWVYYSCRAFWFKERLFNQRCSGSYQVCTMFPMKCYVLWWRVGDTKDSHGIFISKEAVKDFIFFFLKKLNIADLRSSVSFRCTAKWFRYIYIYILFPYGSKIFVTQSCLSLCSPIDWSPPASPVHGIL